MTKLLAIAAGAAVLGAAIGVGATQLGGGAVRAGETVIVPEKAAVKPRPTATTTGGMRNVAAPSAAKRRATAGRNDEQSDSPSDNRDPALSGNSSRSNASDDNDPSGNDDPGPADETGTDEAAGPDDRGNNP
jgi:hypothetical protein